MSKVLQVSEKQPNLKPVYFIMTHNIEYTYEYVSFMQIMYVPIGTTISLSQTQYSVAEGEDSATETITLSSETSEDVVVEVTISNGSANGNVV